jgi:hypothetical protein
MASGGYRQPAKPAPASGPGKSSRRTDGGPGQPVRSLTDAAYGEQATYRADQQGAPMAAGQAQATDAPMPGADLSQVVPFGAPSQRPSEPVTSGADAGAGPGMQALGVAPQQDPSRQYVADALPMFELAALLPFANLEFRQFVRRLRGGGLG